MFPLRSIRDASLPLWSRQHVAGQRGSSPLSGASTEETAVRRRGGALFRLRLERGWNMDRLARKAGLSRTTVYALECGTIARPRASTLRRLAVALGLTVGELESRLAAESSPTTPSSAESREGSALAADCDRRTNPRVAEVARSEPARFAGWSRADWDQLYSTFGVGGSLSDEGVRLQADRINRQRELTFKLQLLLQTHLAPVAEEFVNRLYGEVTGAEAPEVQHTTSP